MVRKSSAGKVNICTIVEVLERSKTSQNLKFFGGGFDVRIPAITLSGNYVKSREAVFLT